MLARQSKIAPTPRTTDGALAAFARVPRFIRNAIVSLPTFLIDLGLLFVLIRWLHVNYLLGTATALVLANALAYFLARRFVFVETRRNFKSGLIYYLAIAVLSTITLTLLMWISVDLFHVEVILSRVIGACIVGTAGYLTNRVFNFRIDRLEETPQN